MPLKLGDTGPVVTKWRAVMAAMFPAYKRAPSNLGPLDPGDLFGPRAVQWQTVYQRRTRQLATLPQDQWGVVSDKDLSDLKIVLQHRPISCYSAPGSGVPGFIGPPYDLGEWCRAMLNLNHIWLDYPIGGYMGLMGGDPKFSYDDIIGFEADTLARNLGNDADLQAAMRARRIDPHAPVAWEGWFFGYSQSADGMKRAVAALFGPGGTYELVRDRINGIIVFGDPTTPGTGIARLVWTSPPWIDAITHVINNPKDFYGIATDRIRPLMYEWFTKAEAELPFVIYSAQIVIPAMLGIIAPFMSALPLGGLTSALAIPLLAGQTGLGVETLAPIIGGITTAKTAPNPDLIKLLSVQGLLTSFPDLLALITALPGLQAHGDYYAPHAEFADASRGWGPRSGIQVAFDTVAGFRR